MDKTGVTQHEVYTLKVVAFGKWVINFEIAERSQTEVADPLSQNLTHTDGGRHSPQIPY